MRVAWLAVVCALVAANATGQDVHRVPAPAADAASELPLAHSGGSSSVFRSAVDLVALNVVVTDRAQQFVTGLTSADFTVLEDGVPQELSLFAARDVPLDLALLLDTSGSMALKMPVVQEAATNFLATLRPGDRAMVVDIKSSTKILYPLGPDVAAATAAVRGTAAGGSTGLFNGLYTTLKQLVKARPAAGQGELRRQAIVVLSDGMDTASLLSFDDVLDVARQSGVATFTITVRSRFAGAARGPRASSPSEFAMKTLAEETGARPFFPNVITDLASVYESIATELASQYSLAYTPKAGAQNSEFRKIAVRVLARPEVRARTRSGYTPRRGARMSE